MDPYILNYWQTRPKCNIYFFLMGEKEQNMRD